MDMNTKIFSINPYRIHWYFYYILSFNAQLTNSILAYLSLLSILYCYISTNLYKLFLLVYIATQKGPNKAWPQRIQKLNGSNPCYISTTLNRQTTLFFQEKKQREKSSPPNCKENINTNYYLTSLDFINY